MSRCKPHPLCKEQMKDKEEPLCVWHSGPTDYCADMSVALHYYNAQDKWNDDHSLLGLGFEKLLAAIGLLRSRAEAWNLLPEKIAVCGFSAGGHLALSGAVLDLPDGTPMHRPNAVLLAYPVITAGKYAHRGSFVQLAGSEDPAAQQPFTLEDKITPATTPVFVWHTMEDQTVPVENTLLLLTALRRAGVPCEAHLFEKGRHGTSISTAEVDAASAHRHHWVELALEWLGETFDFDLK